MSNCKKINQAVILAGGLGTRLRPLTDTIPKPMIEIEDKPFLEYLINQVKDFGINNILLLLGYLPEKIIEYFGDGSKWDINIEYSVTPIENDTGARLLAAKDKIADQFLLMYCDNYCPLEFDKMEAHFFSSNALIQITGYTNKDGYTKNNLKIDENGFVNIYDKKRISENLNGVDIGYALINKRVFEYLPSDNVNFEEAVYPKLVNSGMMSVYSTNHRYYSVGSWERIELTKAFFKPKKVIFLDRDGTLNIKPPKAQYLEKPEDFIWIDGSDKAVKLLNDQGYTVIIITNQPGIARGMVTQENLDAIHVKMNLELNKIGAHVDKIYYCPHGWDEGCDCRKPKPGMLYKAQKELSIDLTKAILIGDDERDIEAGQLVGCKTILVTDRFKLIDAVNQLIKIKRIASLGSLHERSRICPMSST